MPSNIVISKSRVQILRKFMRFDELYRNLVLNLVFEHKLLTYRIILINISN